MPKNSDEQITLFVRDETTARRAFNSRALKAFVEPAEARNRGYPLKRLKEVLSDSAA